MTRPLTIKQLGFDPRVKLGQNSPLLPGTGRPRARNLEHQEQVALFAWADGTKDQHPYLAFLFAVPNWFGVRTAIQGARAKAEGRKKGVPDIWLPVARGPYHGLVIELKVGKNVPSHEQRQWLSFLDHQGWKTHVAYSAEEAKTAILEYLDLGVAEVAGVRT